ncbi:hypothetical protein WJX81_007719 [Elliptochloris bilobata]|uniref:Uncharacterized protein n=1 Tax=Elliptochloris bilobata TaxID=381761 RepID=A0AAW1RV23_9CHLO
MSSPGSTSQKRRRVGAPDPLLERLSRDTYGSRWDMSSLLTRAQALARWPRRLHADGGPEAMEDELENGDESVAIAHFGAACVGAAGRVILGDYITEMFEDPKGRRFIGGKWMFSSWDTTLRVVEPNRHYLPLAELDRRRLFKASDADLAAMDQLAPLTAGTRVVRVKQAAAAAARLAQGQPRADSLWNAGLAAQQLGVLELYCGAGGLAFMDCRTDSMEIKTRWGVDLNVNMCDAFRANYSNTAVVQSLRTAEHPEANEVQNMGVVEFLALCVQYKRLTELYPGPTESDAESIDEDDEQVGQQADGWQVLEILRLTICAKAERVQKNGALLWKAKALELLWTGG